MKIYAANNQLFLDVEVTEGYRFKQIMGENRLYLTFSLDYYTEVPIGAWCMFNNEKYFLLDAQEPTKNNTQNFDYKLNFDTYIAYLQTQIFEFVTVCRDENGNTEKALWENKADFSLTGTPDRFLQLLVDNMNEKDKEKGWTVGEYLQSNELLIDFSSTSCYDVLGILADKFDTEWEVEGKTIHLRKVEKMKESAIPLAYGMDKGLLSGITRSNYQSAIGRIIVKTSDRNIDQSAYGSQTLKMPKSTTIMYEGIEYVTDSTGTKIQRKTPIIQGNIIPEEIVDLTKIYPQRVGTVSKVIEVDDSQGLYDFYDDSIPASLNFKDMIIPGETMIVVFQTGQLAGQGGENGLTVDYIHSDRKFLIKPNTDNGLIVPQGTLIPSVGDKYAVFHIMLPQQYIDDAQNEVMNEAVKKLYTREQVEYSYKATLSELYSKRNWGAIGGYLNIGNFVKLSVPEFFEGTQDIRIISVKEYVDKPKQPVIELSNSVTGRSEYSSTISKVQTQEQTNNRIKKDLINYAKRGWSDTQELIGAVKDMVDDFENAELSADVFKGMIGLFGSESLQYQFLDTDWSTAINPFISFDPVKKQLTCFAARLQHMTLGVDTVQPNRSTLEYKFWNVSAYISPVLTETSEPYFLYIKAAKTSKLVDGKNIGEATFFISTDKIQLGDIAGYYTLWVGYLNSENMEGDRSFRSMYGYTEILPGQITVDKLLSTSGALVIDLLNGVITARDGATIQGNIKFLSNNGKYEDVANAVNDTNQKVDNLQIGGTNLLLNSSFKQTDGWRKEGAITSDSSQVSPFNTACNVMQWSGSGGWFQRLKSYTGSINERFLAGVSYTLSFYAKADSATTLNVGAEGLSVNYFNLTTQWQKFTHTFTGNGTAHTIVFYAWEAITNIKYLTQPKLEVGNKATDWSPAPEDAQVEIDQAKKDATDAQTSANEASQNVSKLNTYVDGTFKDGLIDNAEAKAIEKYLNTLDETMAQVEATYNKLYINSYLVGSTKTALLNAKVNLFGARDTLKKTINSAIADGKTTVAEKADVDTKFSAFNASLKTFQNAVEDANKAIQEKLDSLSTDKVNALVIGGRNYVLNSDTFISTGSKSFTFSDYKELRGKTITISVDIEVENATGTRIGFEPAFQYADGTVQYIGAWHYPSNNKSFKGRVSTTATLYDKAITGMTQRGIYIQCTGTLTKVGHPKLEIGNKATDWSPAPEDAQDRIDEVNAKAEALGYLQTALQNRTEIDGGLLLSSLLKLGTFSGNTFADKAGINGTAKNNNDVVAWFGGTLQQAIQNLASIVFRMDGSGQLAKGNIKWDANGNTTHRGTFETSLNGNRIVMNPSTNSFKMFNQINGIDHEIIHMSWEDIGFGLIRPKITLKEYSSASPSEVMASVIISTQKIGFYRYGNEETPFFEIAGPNYSQKKIRIGSFALPTSKPTTSSTLWKDGEYIKITP